MREFIMYGLTSQRKEFGFHFHVMYEKTLKDFCFTDGLMSLYNALLFWGKGIEAERPNETFWWLKVEW